ncbi:hypothetical protein [Saccharothrix sp. ST-888]|uniref:hypothetical protein n=1 Tax=Saccharothrix sp. ST-888 TaxID=1427391 RepID=UPI0005ED14D8|nr:hypothetical protein [Saccharothrix sp. ST-888]KJK59054.1 hypothetical protein UK12_06565 [Saccharothrix sp. ST-888]
MCSGPGPASADGVGDAGQDLLVGERAERGITGGRLLRRVGRWGSIREQLAAATVNDISKWLTEAADLAEDEQGRTFAAHGWRASGYSAARTAGAPEESANRHGRWWSASRAARGYDRDRGAPADHPMAKVAAQQAAAAPQDPVTEEVSA